MVKIVLYGSKYLDGMGIFLRFGRELWYTNYKVICMAIFCSKAKMTQRKQDTP